MFAKHLRYVYSQNIVCRVGIPILSEFILFIRYISDDKLCYRRFFAQTKKFRPDHGGRHVENESWERNYNF